MDVGQCICHLLKVTSLFKHADMKLGRNVARTFLDYYKLIGYINAKPSSGISPKSSKRGTAESEKYDVQFNPEDGT